MKKILITGTSGMLGKDIFSVFHNFHNFHIYGLDKIIGEKLPIEKQIIGDLTDYKFLNNTLNKINPDVIIHCAAIVNLQICESNKSLANLLHVEATKKMANFNPLKTKLIFISTDSAFDGIKGNYSETDAVNPLNYYAKSKVLGEDAAKSNPNHLIIRTNIFGYNIPLKKSLAEWAIANFDKENRISGFVDIIFNAIYTKYFARILYELVKKDITGIINLASINNLSKYSFLKYLGMVYSNRYDLVEASFSRKTNFKIQRPLNTTLNVNKLLSISYVPSVEEGIEELVKDYSRDKNYEEN